MSAKVMNLRNLRKKDFEIIKELSLLGAHIVMEMNRGLSDEQHEALFSLISRCGNEILDDDGNVDYNFDIDFKIIENYNEIVFWRELAKKLAARDTLEDLAEGINENNFDKYEKIKTMYEANYLEKFKVSKLHLDLHDNKEDMKFDNKFLPY